MIDPPRDGEGDRGAKRRGGGAFASRVPPNVERARKLRREMSYPEVLLWQRLRGSPMGIRFRRGHPIGNDYVADFYCAAARLVVEVDGQIHAYSIESDAVRDGYMLGCDLQLIRVPAVEVLRNADEAAAAIVSLASTPLHHPRKSGDGPPPRSGEDQGGAP